MMKVFFKFLFYTAIPGISTYLANSDLLFMYCIEHHLLSADLNIEFAQEVCLLISVLFTVFVIGPKIAFGERKVLSSGKRVNGLYTMIHQLFKSCFEKITGNESVDFNMRIFVPKITPIYWIMTRVFRSKNQELYFTIKNVAPFARPDTTEHLFFRVKPNPQGLVGSCYSTGKIVWDQDLKQNNDKKWRLESVQIQRTSALLWSICVPVIDERGTTIAVIAFDSTSTPIDIESHRDELGVAVRTFSVLLYDSVPDLFKRKWALR